MEEEDIIPFINAFFCKVFKDIQGSACVETFVNTKLMCLVYVGCYKPVVYLGALSIRLNRAVSPFYVAQAI
jgi:hypothetical protein